MTALGERRDQDLALSQRISKPACERPAQPGVDPFFPPPLNP
jgi:hypothetical protein